MKENSYTELMKSSAMNKKKKDYVQNLYIEMLLTEALLKREKEKLYVHINQSLDERNEKAFKKFSAQFRVNFQNALELRNTEGLSHSLTSPPSASTLNSLQMPHENSFSLKNILLF